MIKVDSSKSTRKIIVMAATYEEYRRWVRRFGRHMENVEFSFANHISDVKGKHRNKTYVTKLPKCELHPRYQEMNRWAKQKYINHRDIEGRVFRHIEANNMRKAIAQEIPELELIQ